MPSVRMHRSHDVKMGVRSVRAYIGGETYHGVLQNHADKIVAEGAGEIVPGPAAEPRNVVNEHGHATPAAGRRRRRR